MKIVVILLLLCSAIAATARLGETSAEIAKRYGPIQKRHEGELAGTNTWAGLYKYKDYYVSVTFSNNLSVAEMVVPQESRPVERDEFEKLLKEIGGDAGAWKADPSEGRDFFTNSVTKAVALYSSLPSKKRSLLVMSAAYSRTLTKADRQKKGQRTDGF